MNEMYDMSIVTHNSGVIGILVVIFINAYFLLNAKDMKKYKRQMQLFTPIGSLAIALVIFTGMVMMAAKHLDFTIENIAMIIFSVVIIVLEAKRVKTLKYIDASKEAALKAYQPFAKTILQIEFIITLSIAVWMWI